MHPIKPLPIRAVIRTHLRAVAALTASWTSLETLTMAVLAETDPAQGSAEEIADLVVATLDELAEEGDAAVHQGAKEGGFLCYRMVVR